MAIYYGYRDDISIASLLGETITEIQGMEKGSEEVTFRSASGRSWCMWYEPDCCAGCDIEDVCGDVADLIGSPIVMAEDVSNDASLVPPQDPKGYSAESETWTFVKLATAKGYVTLRWYGSSNGYYSEEPSFRETTEAA